jgi:hypothetical protein
LELVKDDPDRLCTHWVTRADVKDSIVTPEDVSTPARPFSSLPVFSLDYGLAYGLHRDCIIASMKKLILKRFLLYEQAAHQHAFPSGSTLYGTSVERSMYLWIARPPKIRSWHNDLASGMGRHQKDTYFIYLAAFFVAFRIFIHTRHIFLCVHKSHFYTASHLLKVASHTYKMQLFPPFIVTALSPFIFALPPVVPVEL